MANDDEVFYRRVFARLQEAIAEVAAVVPEVEAVGCVVLWRLPGQDDIPSVLVQGGAGGPVTNPDQLLRLHLLALRLERYCIDQSAQGIVALRHLVRELATEARTSHATRTSQQAPAAAGDGHHGNPRDDPH